MYFIVVNVINFRFNYNNKQLKHFEKINYHLRDYVDQRFIKRKNS